MSCKRCRADQQAIYHSLHREADNAKILQRYYANREAVLVERKKHRDSHIDDYRDRMLRRKYGLALDEYRSRLRSQGGGCAICGSTSPGGQGEFHVDHDHGSGKVRGLLCHNCNVGLGHFGDDISRLLGAVEYLSRQPSGLVRSVG